MTGVIKLTDDEAKWLGRILDAPTPPLRMSVPTDVSAPLLAHGLLRRMGPNFVITHVGIKALVNHRHERAPLKQ